MKRGWTNKDSLDHMTLYSLVAQRLKRLPAMRETWVRSLGRKVPWRRKWQPTPVFLPGESHGWRSLVGYSPWGRKESDMTEQLHFHFQTTWSLWAMLRNSFFFFFKPKSSEMLLKGFKERGRNRSGSSLCFIQGNIHSHWRYRGKDIVWFTTLVLRKNHWSHPSPQFTCKITRNAC